MNPRELRQIGPYRVLRLIDEGGMSWIFEVEDPTFAGVHRALKMLKPKPGEALEYRRFEAEANLLAHLEHPNLVTIYDYAVDANSGCYYYTMTLIDGPPLSRRPLMAPQQASAVFLDVLAGLAKLHERGVIHRDIKPSNILLTEDGRAVLIDLGIVRVADGPQLTAAGMAIGTVLYMSPEQARGATVGPESDIFSLGLSLFEVLTGANIYDSIDSVDSTSGESVLMYLGGLVQQRQQLDLRLPEERFALIRHVVEKACRLDPSERYPSAQAMRDDLLDRYERMRARDRTTPSFEISGGSRQGPIPEVAKTPRRVAVAVGGLLALVLAGVATQRWLPWDDSPSDSAPRSSSAGTPTQALNSEMEPPPEAGGSVATAQVPSEPEVPVVAAGEISGPSPPRIDAVRVAEGAFWMGCTREKDRFCDAEALRRRLLLDEFRIDRTEVTAADYQRCVDAGGCSAIDPSPDCNVGQADRAAHPANCVSWSDARDYCRWSGGELPTEAQWEKAARGGDGRIYPWGDLPASCDFAVLGNPDPDGRDGCGRDGTWPVGSRPQGASPYDLLDMAGNVAEWTQERTVRGGDWLYGPEQARAVASVEASPGRRKPNYGFRCVR